MFLPKVILYANDGWVPSNGGCLRFYREDPWRGATLWLLFRYSRSQLLPLKRCTLALQALGIVHWLLKRELLYTGYADRSVPLHDFRNGPHRDLSSRRPCRVLQFADAGRLSSATLGYARLSSAKLG